MMNFDDVYDKVKSYDEISISIYKRKSDADAVNDPTCAPYVVARYVKPSVEGRYKDGVLDMNANSLRSIAGMIYAMQDVFDSVQFHSYKDRKDGRKGMSVRFVPTA